MKDKNKSKELLIEELAELRQRVAELKKSEIKHRSAEDALRETARQYRVLVENNPYGIQEIDIFGTILFANKAHHEIYGYEEGALRGLSITEFLTSGQQRDELPVYLRMLVKEQPVPTVYHQRILTKSGEKRDIEVTWNYLRDTKGGVVGFLSILTDVTARKKLEDQLLQSQKMEVVGQFAGGIAHDFNNLLTVIMNYGNILQMKINKDDDTLRPYVDAIVTTSEKAAVLTRDLLSFSRKQVINPKPINLNDIIRKTESLLSKIICDDIEFRTELAENNVHVIADSSQIEQVLMNLVTNACHVMSKGGKLTIRTERMEMDDAFIRTFGYGKQGLYALISLTDTGTGMDEETRKKVFEPFFTTKEVGKGTGLGLTITYVIIKQHNGYINVESEEGKGTTFRIYLPLIKEKVEEERPEEVPLTGGTETVLVAEDETAVRTSLKFILQEYGFTVIETVDGEDAIEKFMENKEKIQLLILDVVMPKKNGKEVYDEIRKVRPDIKVIFTSGYTADAIHTEDISKEKVAFIPKPVSPAGLLKKIREVLYK